MKFKINKTLPIIIKHNYFNAKYDLQQKKYNNLLIIIILIVIKIFMLKIMQACSNNIRNINYRCCIYNNIAININCFGH